MSKTIASEIALEYCKKFPETPNRQLARMLKKEFPELYVDEENVRNYIRYHRGAAGEYKKKMSKTTLKTPARKKLFIPEADNVEYKTHIINPKMERGAIVGDIHFPYHDPAALEVCFDYLYKFKPEFIVFNGDTIDFHRISSFCKDPRKRDIKQEIDMTKNFLQSVRSTFGDIEIIFKIGNHEERYDIYVMQHAAELFFLDEVHLKNILNLEEMGIKTVDRKQVIRYKQLNIIHGHEYRFNISNPVSPARGIFLRTHETTIASHFHQVSEHDEPSISSKKITCWSTGCLCYLHPEYAPLNKWTHCFATIEPEGGLWRIENRKILDGKLI